MPKVLSIMLLSIAKKIKPIMLKIMLSKSRLCSRTDCFIRVYQPFLTAVLEIVTALLESHFCKV